MRLRDTISAVLFVLLVAILAGIVSSHYRGGVAAEFLATESLAAESLATSDAIPAAGKPHVVLISLDTLRPDHLGCYGYDRATSPHLDGLARGGVLFRKTWSQAPWTLPSHMSLLTSLAPSRHRVDSLNRVLPAGIVTLPEVMRQHGYRTAALVNNGQMRKHWGFHRGFDVWREYQVDTPESNCENITRQAVDWLGRQSGDEPFFLFLHYYDAHDAYAAPEAFRRRFGTSLTGEASRALAWRARFPGQPLPDPSMKDELIAAYDAEIAWLDHELGKLFAALPENTLVVVFSDHGEAFEEHGWTLHGATLYEEETRVALLMRHPRGEHAGRIVDAPASLLDVAPTILRQCGIEPPAAFQGIDLAPAIEGKRLPTRIVTSQTKAVIEGAICRSAIAYPWKLIVSEPDGRCELYRLPDETDNLAGSEPAAVEALKRHIENGMSRENYWLVQARGPGKHEVTLDVTGGRIALFVPLGFERDRDSIQTSRDGRRLHWETYPAGDSPDKTAGKSLYVELTHADAELTIDVVRNDRRIPEQVFVGSGGHQPAELPWRVPPDDARRPAIDQAAWDRREGVTVAHFEGDDADSDEDNTRRVDEEILRQLRALKYVE